MTRDGIVLSLLRGAKVCRVPTPARRVPTGPRVGGFAFVVVLGAVVVVTATVVVDLTGALPRVRAGAVRLSVVLCETALLLGVVVVHLPSAQSGVVLPGAVRKGTEVLACSGARDPMLL